MERRAKLDGCILGKDTKIGAKAELVRCLTQAGYEVDAGGKRFLFRWKNGGYEHIMNHISSETYKNEKLEVSDWTAAPDEDSESEGESNESGSGSDDSEE